MPDFVDDGGDDGAIFGRAGGKIALYGGTPTEQLTVAAMLTTSVTLAYLVNRISRLEEVLAGLGLCVFDGLSEPVVPDEPVVEEYGVLYGLGFNGYYGTDVATYQDAEPDPEDEGGSLYGELYIRYGDDVAVYPG